MKKKINILFEESRFGGPQNHFLLINKILQKKYSLTYLINQNGSTQFIKKLNTSKTNIKKFKLNQLEKNFKKIFFYFVFFIKDTIKVKNLISENKPDLVHVVGGVYSIKTFIAAILTKRKVIWHVTDAQSPIFLKIFFNFFYKKSTGLIFASKKSKSYYLGQSKFNSTIIPSPILIGKKKQNYNFKNKILIGTNCNISRVKGLELFLIIAQKYQNYKCKKVFFEIHGNVFSSQKKYFNSLKNLKKNNKINNVLFKKNFTKVEDVLKKFDLYISTSKSESSPTSLWEAMAYGLPIITTNVGDIKFIFRKFKNVIYPNNFKKSFEVIDNMLKKKELRKNIGIFSRKYAKNNFNFEKIAKEQILYYSRII